MRQEKKGIDNMLTGEKLPFSLPKFILFVFFFSFNFNSRIDFSNERIRSNETNGTSQCPKCKTDQECITEVEHRWNKFRYIKLNENE